MVILIPCMTGAQQFSDYNLSQHPLFHTVGLLLLKNRIAWVPLQTDEPKTFTGELALRFLLECKVGRSHKQKKKIPTTTRKAVAVRQTVNEMLQQERMAINLVLIPPRELHTVASYIFPIFWKNAPRGPRCDHFFLQIEKCVLETFMSSIWDSCGSFLSLPLPASNSLSIYTGRSYWLVRDVGGWKKIIGLLCQWSR